ncbi:unnamed protein product [Discosporangium mesarthrocarpum]
MLRELLHPAGNQDPAEVSLPTSPPHDFSAAGTTPHQNGSRPVSLKSFGSLNSFTSFSSLKSEENRGSQEHVGIEKRDPGPGGKRGLAHPWGTERAGSWASETGSGAGPGVHAAPGRSGHESCAFDSEVGGKRGAKAPHSDTGLWMHMGQGGDPAGRLLSLLSLRIGDLANLPSMSMLWMAFVRELRGRWEDGVFIPRMLPNLHLDGCTMLKPACSGQGISITAEMRSYVSTGWGGRKITLGSQCLCQRDNPMSRVRQPHPDTRLCLAFQKLQMLNCCMEDQLARKVLLSQAHLDGGPGSMNGGGTPAAPSVSEGSESEGLEDDIFFDSREVEIEEDSGVVTGGGDWEGIEDAQGQGSGDGHREGKEIRERRRGSNGSGGQGGEANAGDGGEVVSCDSLPSPPPGALANLSLSCPWAAVACGVAEVAPGEMRLLATGEAMFLPELQESGPITGDIAEQQGMPQARWPLKSRVLRSDMGAFRAANTGGVLADFVRWYRPEWWEVCKTGSMRMSLNGEPPCEEEPGSSQTDEDPSLRLVWPGHGKVCWPPTEQDSDHQPPRESEVWVRTWQSAGRNPLPARAQAPLFGSMNEGEKALHYLETISPCALLAQLLSSLLGLSTFLLDKVSPTASTLPFIQDVVGRARGRAREAVSLLAENVTESACGWRKGVDSAISPSSAPSIRSTFQAALLASQSACEEVCRAELAVAKASSLFGRLPRQEDLVNDIVSCEEGHSVEVRNVAQRRALRDLLHAQQSRSAFMDETGQVRLGGDNTSPREETEGMGPRGTPVILPPPLRREYVFRCQTPAPFYKRNIGRGEIEAYPIPPSRMYAATDGRRLRLAMSICESDL